MGCEGYATFRRIEDGHHLINLEEDPVFVVTEPIAMVPFFIQDFGKRTHTVTTFNRDIDNLAKGMIHDDCLAIILGSLSWGLLILPKSRIWDEKEKKYWIEFGQPEFPTIGALKLSEVEKWWAKFEPGYWFVESANDTDQYYHDQSYSPRYELRKGLKLGTEIKEMVWT